MNKIFIDANIYLDFFDSNKKELKKLLATLLEIKENLFVGSQIVNEVNRNKLGVAERSLINHFENLSNIKSINLPEHLEEEEKETGEQTLQAWNAQCETINNRLKNLKNELKNLIHKTLGEIMRSQDNISKTFHHLFENSLEANEREIQAARYRKEIGNPPGKPKDPLGDQISWEQFLSCSISSEKIWIITKDPDYYTDFQGEKYLNPFLYNELIRVSTANPEIFCFESLAKGLRHFSERSSEEISSLPTEEELKIITEEETSDERVVRGGSWRDAPDSSSSASRDRFLPGDKGNNIGFRLACRPCNTELP